MGEREPDAEVARLVYDEAVRGVQSQEGALDNLRARASALLAASAIATSFLAGVALSDRGSAFSVFTILGFLSAALAAIFVVLVLIPYRGWKFSVEPRVLADDYYYGNFADPPKPQSIEDTRIKLARHMGGWIDGNEDRLNWLYRSFVAAALVVGMNVSFWLIDLLWFYEPLQTVGP